MRKECFKNLFLIAIFLFFVSCCNLNGTKKTPVDYVNPYMGNISHLLVPTYPTVHLPNSMLRVYPERADYTSVEIKGLPVTITNHRGSSAFNISPVNGTNEISSVVKNYSYDNEKTTPYRYSVYLDDENIQVDFAPSHRSGIYHFVFEKENSNQLIINTRNGKLEKKGNGITACQLIDRGPTTIYLYLETGQPISNLNDLQPIQRGRNEAFALNFESKTVNLRYGISFISSEQAEKNLKNEINTYSVDEVARKGRKIWNETLGKIEVKGGSNNDKAVFYTSLYRTYERMINISEDGRYYSAFDHQIHDDNGIPFYTDDWIWDTYRATHPLRVLIEESMENDMIASYIRMAQQDTVHGWMPTFPGVTGDSHCMNGNHAVAVVWDAYIKGLRGYDLEAAYKACRATMTEKSWLPWVKIPNTEYDEFFYKNGYFPALRVDEKESVAGVHSFEKRQPVAVLMGACYDFWCLSQIAKALSYEEDYRDFLEKSYNMRHIYNAETAFFHPKDKDGAFIREAYRTHTVTNADEFCRTKDGKVIGPFDYRYSGGMGAREYYDENNAYVFRWDVPHNPAFLVELMGGAENYVAHLDQTFREPLGKSKFEFYSQLPDHSGNVGQFSMANEPSLHIPYMYNYAGQPWKTQKTIRALLNQWFRNDLMGIPGDEDGGGLSAFVVFSMMGFYPVTPGMPAYNIGSPVFQHIKIKLSNGKIFEIEAKNSSDKNKYIQSATLNGKTWDKPWFSHEALATGGKLVLVMGDKANKNWGSALENVPPSAEKRK